MTITYYNVGSEKLKLHSLKLDLRLSLSLSLSLSLRLFFFKVRFRFCVYRNCITHLMCFSVWLLRKRRKTVEKWMLWKLKRDSRENFDSFSFLHFFSTTKQKLGFHYYCVSYWFLDICCFASIAS